MFDPERLICDLFHIQNNIGDHWALTFDKKRPQLTFNTLNISTRDGIHYDVRDVRDLRDTRTETRFVLKNVYDDEVIEYYGPVDRDVKSRPQTIDMLSNMMVQKPNLTRLSRADLHNLIDAFLASNNLLNIKWIYNTTTKYSADYEKRMEFLLKI